MLGFAAAGASLISETLAAVFGFGAAWSAQVIIWVATVGSQLPGSEWHLSVTPLTLAWVALHAAARGFPWRTSCGGPGSHSCSQLS